MNRIVSLLLAVTLMVGAANAAKASYLCYGLATATGTAVGGAVGLVVDIAAFGGTGGLGTAIGGSGGGAAGGVAAHWFCPSDEPKGIEEVHVDKVLRTCTRTTYLPFNPVASKKDFCSVPGNKLIGGPDRSMMEGRQIYLKDVLTQVKPFFETAKVDSPHVRDLFRDIAGNIEQCSESFKRRWKNDDCKVKPTALTASMFGADPGRWVRTDVHWVIMVAEAISKEARRT